uniref:maternal protein pumilio n=1 Tax=Anopheles coluzzii TaxID=1518534 RepID=UPI0020FF8BF7|nr:maternal protein pumilio [Anopheles coluzzii]
MSSKKEEIADSWEEIDEERLANAITILKNSTSPGTEQTDSAKPPSAPSGNAARQNSLPQMLEEELRPKMVVRPMQILKRPQSSGGSEGKSPADSKPKTQIKSLDQRRQEYAEARLRILGSAHDDEEAETKKTTPATNGYRVNNVNNNNSSSGNSSSNPASGSVGPGAGGGGGGSGVGGEVMAGNGANNNASNVYRYHSPYRQQAPIGTFPPAMQNGPPGRAAQAGPGLYYSTPNLHHHPHHPHHPMHGTHPMHHPFPPMPQHHHHHHQQQQQQQQQLSSHPYQHQQHFAPLLNHQPAGGGRDGGWYAGGRNGGNVPGAAGYYPGKGYGEGGGPMSSPLLGHAPPGVIPNHTMPYSGGASGVFAQANSHGSTGGSNVVSNQHVLRLPAGPDGSQGFNMRR